MKFGQMKWPKMVAMTKCVQYSLGLFVLSRDIKAEKNGRGQKADRGIIIKFGQMK